MAQVEELSIWELDVPFPYTSQSLEEPSLPSIPEQERGRIQLYQETKENSQTKDERHASMHEHFCNRRYCKYHNTAWRKGKQDSPGEYSSGLSWTDGTWQYRPKKGMVSWKWRFMMCLWRMSVAIWSLRCCWLVCFMILEQQCYWLVWLLYSYEYKVWRYKRPTCISKEDLYDWMIGKGVWPTANSWLLIDPLIDTIARGLMNHVGAW